jgi:ATP-dependent DNA ligase
MRRRGPFQFVAFDVLALNGKDVRHLELTDRRRLLRTIVPKRSRSILCAPHIGGRGRELFAPVCSHDLEGIVAKRKRSAYDPSSPLALWPKIKNPDTARRAIVTSSSSERDHRSGGTVVETPPA